MMNPRKSGRFCGECKKVVHDLSKMREADAKKRLALAPETLCVRYLHDEHGNIWFADTPLLTLRRGAGLAALALMPVLTACMGSAPLDPDDTVTAVPPSPPDDPDAAPDAAPDARTTADPVVGSDAGADADAAPDDSDAGNP